MRPTTRWFTSKDWQPFAYQRRTWAAYLAGRSGLVHAPTGTGKTQAVWLGPVEEYLRERRRGGNGKGVKRAEAEPLRVLWITPLRALASDTMQQLRAPVEFFNLPWTIESRTGDTSAALKAKQRKQLPTALVTTPESLSLLLSYEDAAARFSTLRCVIIDEWHELLGTKRGVQTELCLARLKTLSPGLRVWGLSATLGNTDEAMRVLLGCGAERGVLVCGAMPKAIEVRTLIPQSVERFPWSGHLGLRMLGPVIEAIEAAGTTLVFTNTRSQAETWFANILRARPDWIGSVALHHGSLDRGVRTGVENLLRAGELRCVVCTSSLDLGVDFDPVDRVIQVGSPKGVARMMQRAGRSGHRPGGVSEIVGVPTNALELVEFAAAREAAKRKEIESRVPPDRPLDVLVQHLVTLALGGGFEAPQALGEVRRSHAYRSLSDEEWGWAMEFVTRGGPALRGYPQFTRVVERGGRYGVESKPIARMHRMSIGTITSDTAMRVVYATGRTLGTIEEGFIARLRVGDRFTFAGRTLELIRVREMRAIVRPGKGRGLVPTWQGGKSPLSTELAAAVRRKFAEAVRGVYRDAEMTAARPLLELQQRWSALPGPSELLIEVMKDRDGHHAFVYPFEGRLVHEGLSALVAWRMAERGPRSVTATCNDYGMELLSNEPLDFSEADWRELLRPGRLMEDLMASLNAAGLARRKFRDIARVAGLITPGYPGAGKPTRQLQASSEMFFDVLSEFDPKNLLLEQSRREVLERELEAVRMRRAMERLAGQRIVRRELRELTPLALPIWADRLREAHVSSEKWRDRVQRVVMRLEAAAGEAGARKLKREVAAC